MTSWVRPGSGVADPAPRVGELPLARCAHAVPWSEGWSPPLRAPVHPGFLGTGQGLSESRLPIFLRM